MAIKPEVMSWVQKQVSKYGALTLKVVEEMKLVDDFKAAFDRSISKYSIVDYYRRINNVEPKKKSKNDNQLVLVLEKSEFILYIFNGGIFGFDTKEDVKAYLQANPTNSPFKVFACIPAKVETIVEVVI